MNAHLFAHYRWRVSSVYTYEDGKWIYHPQPLFDKAIWEFSNYSTLTISLTNGFSQTTVYEYDEQNCEMIVRMPYFNTERLCYIERYHVEVISDTELMLHDTETNDSTKHAIKLSRIKKMYSF